jgi:hypothetical protein
MESEGHEENYRAVIDGGYPEDEPVGRRWGKVESALWRRRRSHSPTAVVRKNSIRLPSDRDAGTYLFGFPALGSPKNQSCEQKILLSRTEPVQS